MLPLIKRYIQYPLCGWALLPFCLQAAPVGGTITSGTGTITPNGSQTDIQQISNNLAINWTSFNIQAGEQVNFIQPSASSIALNRDFSGIASELYGDLNANGQVFLLNSAGILIGPTANINVGGLFLSDMSLTDEELSNFTDTGTLRLIDQDNQMGGISIEGAITTTTRQGITIIAQFIENQGDLTANNGNVTLAVAGGPILVTDSSGTLGVQVEDGLRQDISNNQILLDNGGNIRAINGDISINIQYLSSLNVTAVRNTGLINAVGIGYGHINQTIVLQAPDQVIEADSPVEETLSEALSNSPDIGQDDPLATTPSENVTALDRLVADCQSEDPNDRECIKKRAIKRYLGRLLIGGGLPE